VVSTPVDFNPLREEAERDYISYLKQKSEHPSGSLDISNSESDFEGSDQDRNDLDRSGSIQDIPELTEELGKTKHLN
jgi:hypothetical protein